MGIRFSTDLHWDSHCSKIISKACTLTLVTARKRLYLMLVRSQLTLFTPLETLFNYLIIQFILALMQLIFLNYVSAWHHIFWLDFSSSYTCFSIMQLLTALLHDQVPVISSCTNIPHPPPSIVILSRFLYLNRIVRLWNI